MDTFPLAGWARAGGDSFAGIAADAATVVKWGYQLYGGRLLSTEAVRAMMKEPSNGNVFPGVGYGLGTMVFSGLCTDPTYGHTGDDVSYAALLVVVPKRHLAAALLTPEGGRDLESIMRDTSQPCSRRSRKAAAAHHNFNGPVVPIGDRSQAARLETR